MSHTSVSINGVSFDVLDRGVAGRIAPGGLIEEHEHRGLIMLADGTIVSDVRATARCDVCAAEMDLAILHGRITPQAALFASRHRPESIARSAASGIQLCPRHQRPMVLDDGALVILSPLEAQDLELKRERSKRWRRLLGVFFDLESPGGVAS